MKDKYGVVTSAVDSESTRHGLVGQEVYLIFLSPTTISMITLALSTSLASPSLRAPWPPSPITAPAKIANEDPPRPREILEGHPRSF